MARFTPVTSAAEQKARTDGVLKAADEYAAASARDRTDAAKPALLATLDALKVTADNLRAAIEVAHVFDIRAVGDALRAALGEIDRAEARVARESGLEVSN